MLRAVSDVLARKLPPGWRADWSVGERVGSAIADALVTIEAPDGQRAELVVEAKVRLEPRELEAAVDQARFLSVDFSDDPASRASPLIAARFLSGRVRAGLIERDVSYIDTTGNLRLVLARPGLFVEASGADRDPLPADRRLRSLKGTAAARVVRALFDATLPLSVSELAARAGVSTAQSSRVADLLDREVVLQRDSRGSVIAVDPPKLIERWAEDYSFLDANATGLYLEPRTLDKLLDRLPSSGLRYAVSGSLGARLLAEYADAKLALIYVDDIDRAAQALGLTRVEERGNVLLAEPYDAVVFDGLWQRDGVNYVAPARLALDLLTPPGRGRLREKSYFGSSTPDDARYHPLAQRRTQRRRALGQRPLTAGGRWQPCRSCRAFSEGAVQVVSVAIGSRLRRVARR